MTHLDDKNISSDKPKRPESNTIVTFIIVVALMAAFYFTSWHTTPYYLLKSSDTQDEFGPPHGHHHPWHDANMPDPDRQKPQEIIAYMDSSAFKKLSAREQLEYSKRNARQVIEYDTKTYSTLPKEQRTAYLDRIIDRIQAQRANMKQMPPDANDLNSQWRRGQLMNDMRARMQQRHINAPTSGPPPGEH